MPRTGFERFRPWFDQELALLESINEDIDGWESMYHRIAETFTLVGPDGPVAEFLLHIQDDRA